MRYTVGVFCVVLAGWIFYSALAKKAHVLAIARALPPGNYPTEAQLSPTSLAAFGEIMRPVVLGALGLVAVKLTLAYLFIDGGRYLSAFDFGAFLSLLAAYGYSVIVTTTYRESDAHLHVAKVQRSAQSTSNSAQIVEHMS